MRTARLIKIWAGQIRAPFLVLSVVLVLIGCAVAAHDGVFNGLRFALALVGVILAHMAVNMFNELHDHATGIDQHTRRTPFSGGSGTLQRGDLDPRSVLYATMATLAVALIIGIVLTILSGWQLLVFIVLGGLATVFYTSHLARWMIGELAAGICLGTFVVLGAYFCQAETLTAEVVWLSIPPGILTALLLFLNEFPDLEADREGGRRHLVIVLGRARAAVVYTAAMIVMYSILVIGVIAGLFPVSVLMALATIPLALKASLTALMHPDKFEKMVGALGANVGAVLGTDLLIAVAYFI
jgi:1,4-dihydroxy-2-naphthoate octaprenyltransferase